jgi:hypothetical protein
MVADLHRQELLFKRLMAVLTVVAVAVAEAIQVAQNIRAPAAQALLLLDTDTNLGK